MANLTHVLTKPIQAHGEEVRELSFREPTGLDILHAGNPVIMDMAAQPPVVTHDERKMTAMLARLADVPPSSINQMASKDWTACAWLVTDFFMPLPGAI